MTDSEEGVESPCSVPFPERLANTMFGLSALSWVVLGLINSSVPERFSVVRISIAALNLCVGILFLFRDPLKKNGPVPAILASLPSLLIAGFALKLAAPLNRWPLGLEILFASGTAVAIYAFLTLGRSFALLPAVRTIVSDGPFRFIRHPAYAGEFLMVLACALSQPTLANAWPAVIVVPLIGARIIAEESVLKTDPEYQTYSKKVPRRLLPGIW